nr:immunoglobulin heavy chain junction region [Macaca mulatta]
CARQDSNSDYW